MLLMPILSTFAIDAGRQSICALTMHYACSVLARLQIQETDIDTLERCCAAMAFGDLDAEAPHSLTETSFLRLFRLAQLTVEYLLHIQDRLVWENGLLKVAMLLIIWLIQSCGLITAALWWDLGEPANVLSNPGAHARMRIEQHSTLVLGQYPWPGEARDVVITF